jgi:hypothetical protein
MFSFFRPKKPAFSRAQQLSARPVRLVAAELVPTDGGGAKITVTLKPRRVHRILLRFPENATKTFELDAVGVFVWGLCDGKSSVQSVITRVSRHLRISPREAEVATMAFMQMLMKKGLLGLEVRKPQAKD